MSDLEQIDLDGNAKKLKSYTIEKKLEVVAYAKKAKSINSASKRYNVDRNCVRERMEQEGKLSEFKESTSKLSQNKKLPGQLTGKLTGRLLKFAGLDEELSKWVRDRREKSLKVSRRIIQQKVMQMFVPGEQGDVEFKASITWLKKFMDRHSFRARVPTTVCQKPPSDYEQGLVKFVIYLSQLREKNE